MYNKHIKMPNPDIETNQDILERELNLFLNYLKIYNSSYGTPQNTVEEEEEYAKNLLTIVPIKYKLPLPQNFDIQDIGVSLLFKFVNQKAYEKTSQFFFAQGNKKFKYTYLNFVVEKGTNFYHEIEKSLASTIFEEIVFWVIKKGTLGSKPICSIHCPKAGDILMVDKTSVEVKSTTIKGKAIRLFEESYVKAKRAGVTLSYGIYGGECSSTNNPTNDRPIIVCLKANELGSGTLNEIYRYDFIEEHLRFEHAFDFAIRNSGIETVKPGVYTVKSLLKKFYSDTVLYYEPIKTTDQKSSAPARRTPPGLQESSSVFVPAPTKPLVPFAVGKPLPPPIKVEVKRGGSRKLSKLSNTLSSKNNSKKTKKRRLLKKTVKKKIKNNDKSKHKKGKKGNKGKNGKKGKKGKNDKKVKKSKNTKKVKKEKNKKTLKK